MGGAVAFNKQTVKDIDLEGKRVLIRVDYNVPIENGKVVSDYRITESIPTILYLLEQGCSIVLISHLGRPEGKTDPRSDAEDAEKSGWQGQDASSTLQSSRRMQNPGQYERIPAAAITPEENGDQRDNRNHLAAPHADDWRVTAIGLNRFAVFGIRVGSRVGCGLRGVEPGANAGSVEGL